MLWLLIKPSKCQTILLSLFSVLALMAIWLLSEADYGIKIILVLLTIILISYEFNSILLRSRAAIVSIRTDDDQHWQVKTRDGWADAELLKTVFISDLMLILHFKVRQKRLYIALCADNFYEDESFRKLRVRARLGSKNKKITLDRI